MEPCKCPVCGATHRKKGSGMTHADAGKLGAAERWSLTERPAQETTEVEDRRPAQPSRGKPCRAHGRVGCRMFGCQNE